MTQAAWVLWLVAGAFLEALALSGNGTTLSATIWWLRWDSIGRFAMLPLGCWLFYHWCARPRDFPQFGWRDVVALVTGLVWAAIEARAGR